MKTIELPDWLGRSVRSIFMSGMRKKNRYEKPNLQMPKLTLLTLTLLLCSCETAIRWVNGEHTPNKYKPIESQDMILENDKK